MEQISVRRSSSSLLVLPILLGLFGVGEASAQQAASQNATRDPGAHAMASHDLYYGAVLFEKLEWGVGLGGAPNIARWEGQAWYGTDYDKVWVKTQGELERGRQAENAEVQLLYSRLLGYYWDLQAGVRYDPRPRPDRAYGVIGIQGLSPGLFEIELHAFVSERGGLSARLEASYDIYVTQRLVLQPTAEINVAAQRVRELGVNSGISNIEAGFRLRYEFTREVAPYVGVNYSRRFGEAARYARAEGGQAESYEFLTGVRLYF
ncbi:MAG: copper resistance protein B [Azospirillum brasilense]|jgi:copper resistance protein B|nr:MAG: copper resistance protein B [Azospirillum brasilense]